MTQVRIWMKSIYELLLESEQLRLETDDAGPQVTIDNYLGRPNFDEKIMFENRGKKLKYVRWEDV